MAANYDPIATIYDLTSRLVFGDAIIKAQECLIDHIPAHSRVLIAGGGTGWILEKIANCHPGGLTIDYVEVSAQMIALSRQRNYKLNVVSFVQKTIEDHISDLKYDIILTPFILDNFDRDKLTVVFNLLDRMLRKDGLWLYADFVNNGKTSLWWQRLLLKMMYFFFRITTGIETTELVPVSGYFARSYRVEFVASRYRGFILSAVYRKV